MVEIGGRPKSGTSGNATAGGWLRRTLARTKSRVFTWAGSDAPGSATAKLAPVMPACAFR